MSSTAYPLPAYASLRISAGGVVAAVVGGGTLLPGDDRDAGKGGMVIVVRREWVAPAKSYFTTRRLLVT